jgi:hypothetical protein
MKLMAEPPALARSAAISALRTANAELLYAAPMSGAGHPSSPYHVPMGAMICVPNSTLVVVRDDCESRTEQPVMVSQCSEVDVSVVVVTPWLVVVAEKKVAVVHSLAVCVSHWGCSLSVVSWWSSPMVIRGQGGSVPFNPNPDGHRM